VDDFKAEAGPYRAVGWVRRHLGMLRIGGAVIAALALLIFSVDWVGVLIIAVLLAVYEFGLHRLCQANPAAQSPWRLPTARIGPCCQTGLGPRSGPRCGWWALRRPWRL
jgi:hypothetical protein